MSNHDEIYLKCIDCGATYAADEMIYTCPKCGGLLDVIQDYEKIKEHISWDTLRKRLFHVWRYREFIPVNDAHKVTLFEGGTPLYKCNRLSKIIGVKELYVKFEGANPTGSFKDRGMTVGVTKALQLGYHQLDAHRQVTLPHH